MRSRVGVLVVSLCVAFLIASTVHAQGCPTAPGTGATPNTTPVVAPTTASDHIAPDPPQQMMGDMTYKDMVSMMQMDDTHRFGKVMLDQLEWRDAQQGDGAAWDAQAWYGGDYNKLWIKTEGERAAGVTQSASVDVLFDRVIARWWDAQGGIRQDFGRGPARTWLALGLQGLAPYWLDTEATFYVGEEGRTAIRLKADYDLLLTPTTDSAALRRGHAYSKSDAERDVGLGTIGSRAESALTIRGAAGVCAVPGSGVVQAIREYRRAGASLR